MSSAILWFRHGLRLHDNPALLEAIKCAKFEGGKFYAVFIFDGKTSGTESISYNRMKFLLESLADIDKQLKKYGGQLYMFRGPPVIIFHRLAKELNIKLIAYEQDCEPIWRERDEPVENLCREIGVQCMEKVSHTLWSPSEVIKANGGIPPLTYQMFLHTVQTIGLPPRPIRDPDWNDVQFGIIPKYLLKELNYLNKPPTPEDFDIYYENTRSVQYLTWTGGETQALICLNERLRVERYAFQNGYYLPNQAHHDLLGKATSLSAHLRYGCLSVRRFYWNLHDLFRSVQSDNYIKSPGGQHITGQLIWREYFYTMSVKNPNYAKMKDNPICLDIPWYEPNENFEKWKSGSTGYPLIDAAMRQLLAEGWLHHTLRNATATFLTRGGLWFSWEHGMKYFLKHLLDADWSVCAGNWMWVSSSAFEKLLDSSRCTCPIALGRRLDPFGDYIKRYIPELKAMPKEFIHEPWNAPLSVQEANGCVIGIHYPERIINLKQCQEANNKIMKMLRESLIADGAPLTGPPHCRPSNEDEIRKFFWLIDDMVCK